MTSPLFDTRPQTVGLKRGDYTRVANICKVSPTHVRAVALGLRKGSDTITRQLTKRGWSGSRPTPEAK